MSKDTGNSYLPSSFRDPSGYLFTREGELFRQVNQSYKEEYGQLINSGLYNELVNSGLLIPHREVDAQPPEPQKAFKIIKPEPLDFVSYPYEWCFSQLKDAALATLEVQKTALSYGMTLKDASAYNIQFHKSRPVLIDTLSFDIYHEGQPWIPYRQFCQHFLAPLALMSKGDVRLNQLLRVHLDGIPLEMASVLLPRSTYLKFSLLSHVHLHARSQKHLSSRKREAQRGKMSRLSLLGLIDNLQSAVSRLKFKSSSHWADYYDECIFSRQYLEDKKKYISDFVSKVEPRNVWDLGANTGLFSRIPAGQGIHTVSMDIDPLCVEGNYLEARQKGETSILPLFIDLTNPSPGIGWENTERLSFLQRGPADMAVALALVHHLAISNNLPLSKIASFFNDICRKLVIEFVPKEDPRVQELLSSREDVFPNYTRECFENEFASYFSIEEQVRLGDSQRLLYLMKK